MGAMSLDRLDEVEQTLVVEVPRGIVDEEALLEQHGCCEVETHEKVTTDEHANDRSTPSQLQVVEEWPPVI